MAIAQRHRKSIRLKEYDYSTPGEYFITICTYDHEWIFGGIVDEEIKLSPEGMIAEQCWKEIPNHFKDAHLDAFVVMPNHIHGILVLYENEKSVWTQHAVSIHEQFGKPTRGTVPTIIRSYKSVVTKRINELHKTPGSPLWQARYYDHIIRNENELNNIRNYISANVLQWAAKHKNDLPENI